VEYRRGALTEWYVNGPLGLEQGFTLERAAGNSNGKPLTLSFVLSGNVTASVDAGARSLTLHKDGAKAFRYAGLTALDADGRELRAWLEVDGNQLRVRVDDADARYPLTIDPYVQAATLTAAIPCDPTGVCDDGAPGDELGHSVSISADATTIVVGAPYKYTNSVRTGAAYVFVKPSDFDGGWNSAQPIFFKAKLLASDGATNGLFLGLLRGHQPRWWNDRDRGSFIRIDYEGCGVRLRETFKRLGGHCRSDPDSQTDGRPPEPPQMSAPLAHRSQSTAMEPRLLWVRRIIKAILRSTARRTCFSGPRRGGAMPSNSRSSPERLARTTALPWR
jgi:hypothetical protein